MVQLKFSEFTGKFSKFTINFGRCMAIWGKMPLFGGLHGLWGIYRGQTWCRLVFMASVSVYEGIDSMLGRINCIFGQFQLHIWSISTANLGGYGYMGENTTFGRVMWAVGHISRSDLVQAGVYGKCERL